MKTTLMSSLLFFVLFSFSNQASAYLHFEPSLAYTLAGSWEVDDSDDDFSSLELGMRLGYQSPQGFQIGANVDIGVGSFDDEGYEADSISIDPYLMFGYQASFGLRGFLGLSPSTLLDLDSDFSETSYLGYGLKIGGGYLIRNIVAINLYYKFNDYYDFDSDDSDGFESLDIDFKTHSINLSVSFPFNFGGKRKHTKPKIQKELNEVQEQKLNTK